MKKMPISCLLINYNGASTLEACLEGVSFCHEIIIVDLYSTDNSVEIAHRRGLTVLYHDLVPGSEWIQEKMITKTKFKWVLLVDPDEVYPKQLALDISRKFDEVSNKPEVGCITVPIEYYFKRRKLIGTKWGGIKNRVALVHNERFSCFARVHTGRVLNPGYDSCDIHFANGNAITHYWSDSWSDLISKHRRYLIQEGQSRVAVGNKTTLYKIYKTPVREFYENYISRKGYKDGITGFLLSIFRAWYFYNVQVKIYKELKGRNFSE